MYLAHWNLREFPFQNVADPRFAYLSDQHQEALARLVYTVRTGKLGAVLTGPYGVGKSLLLEVLAHHTVIRETGRFTRFDAPCDGALDLAASVLAACGLDRRFQTPSAALAWLREAVESESPAFVPLVLALDEAHALRNDPASFDFLQRLLNLQPPVRPGTEARPAMTLLLCGLPELETALEAHPSLRQRLGVGWRLEPLQPPQVREYVAFRMRAAGGDIFAFEEESLALLAEASGGLPRVINHMCDTALLLGFASRASRVTSSLMRQAIEEVQGGPLVRPEYPRHA